MTVLAFETSCDETSVAVVRDGAVLASVVSSQVQLHEEYGGVVPELAAREHLKNLLPVARAAIEQCSVKLSEISAVAATQGPGLPNALQIGFKAAAGVAFVLEKPLIGIHHHEAHLYSPWISGDPPQFRTEEFQPSVSLIVSGGHTLLLHVPSLFEHRVLGGTLDDAAGECFDKIAKLIGLPYPGGPELDRLAQAGNPVGFNFPRPMISDPGDDFSFAGLKTSVRYFLQRNPAILSTRTRIQDLCAAVQEAIVTVLVTKTMRAAQRLNVSCITASGGVTCNTGLRAELRKACDQRGILLRLAAPTLCTDNAAMIGVLASLKLSGGVAATDLDAEIRPNWPL